MKDLKPGYISEYVTEKEVTYSPTGVKAGVDNTPSPEQWELIKHTAVNVYDKLREWVGGPVKINSVYRGPALNKLIKGSATSQHCVGLDPKSNSYGAAFDVDDDYQQQGFTKKTNKEMFFYIKDNLDFDQIIYEFGDSKNPNWVHFSYRPDGKNRKQVLIAIKQDGKTVYLPLKGNEKLVGL
jgi:hypothetical protein